MTDGDATGAPQPARPLVLASASPQRHAILERLGIAHVVRPTGVEERSTGPAEEVALENARRKALAVAADPDELVLGVDTVVAIDDLVLGKPRDADQAREHLERLGGRVHHVLGGVAVVRGGAVITAFVDSVTVTFRDLDDATLAWYLGTREWEGRAGGYAIQERGAALVRRVEGDPLTVVGLPVARLLDAHPELLDPARAPIT